MNFSCPHLELKSDMCLKLKKICVLGRPGCVLAANSKFLINRSKNGDDKGDAHAKRG